MGPTQTNVYRLSWQPLPVPLERELAVDNFLKLRLWLGATQKYAVDEKGGRSLHSSLDSLLAVRLYVLLELAASEAGTKGAFIQPQLLSAFDQACFIQFRIRKVTILIFTILPLFSGTASRLRRAPSLSVDLREGEIEERQLDAASILAEQGFQGVLALFAERALIIREFHDCDGRIRVPLDPRGVVGDIHSYGRRLEENGNLQLVAQ